MSSVGPPGNPTFTNEGPTSITVSWTPVTSTGGHTITNYLLQHFKDGSSTPIDNRGSSLSRNITGLTPGSVYGFQVRACDVSGIPFGFGDESGLSTIKMVSGIKIRHSGSWLDAYAYIRVGGMWKPATPFIRQNGLWLETH
jgi:hypothetical protein